MAMRASSRRGERRASAKRPPPLRSIVNDNEMTQRSDKGVKGQCRDEHNGKHKAQVHVGLGSVNGRRGFCFVRSVRLCHSQPSPFCSYLNHLRSFIASLCHSAVLQCEAFFARALLAYVSGHLVHLLFANIISFKGFFGPFRRLLSATVSKSEARALSLPLPCAHMPPFVTLLRL